MVNTRYCELADCESPVKTRGYCNKHYQRFWKHGDPYKDTRKSHGMTNTKEFRAWHSMKVRCLYPDAKTSKRYKERGILVCERWLESFENFLQDVGYAPSPRHSLDRIDNNGNYEPSNCRWATASQQGNNRSSTKKLVIGGVSMSVTEWSKKLGVERTKVYKRLSRGWSPERALGICQ